MKYLFLLTALPFLIISCIKTDNTPSNQVEIKIIHSTCVQTIAKVITPNTSYGVNWAKNGVIHNNAFNVGVLSTLKIDSVNQIFTVYILPSATLPQVICAMADVSGTNVTHDILKL